MEYTNRARFCGSAPAFFLRCEGGVGSEEIQPEEAEEEEMEPSSERHKVTVLIKEQWSDRFTTNLRTATSRKEYFLQSGSYTYPYLNPDFVKHEPGRPRTQRGKGTSGIAPTSLTLYVVWINLLSCCTFSSDRHALDAICAPIKEVIMPVKIPPELQDFLKGKQGWVATAAKDGTPNVSIKGSLRLLDDEHLIFADIFSLKTRKNLLENPKVAIMVYEDASRRGYMFKGAAELLASGPLYEQTVENMKKVMPQLPAPKYVVKVSVESIYDQSAGPSGGKQVA